MNRIYKTLVFLVLLCAGQQAMSQNFITQWDLSIAGSSPTEISFGTATSGVVNYTWQELSPGSASGSGSWSGSTLTVTGLPAGSIIRLQIAPTNFERIIINNGTDRNRLTLIEQWGSTAWSSMQNAFGGPFGGCANMQVTATDVPDLSGVSSTAQMFAGCLSLNTPSNINTWDTSTINNMIGMFYQANAFNQDIGSWNTAAVTNMVSMFDQASAFNQDIGAWNTAAVTNMFGMFSGASSFNQNIGSWNTASVIEFTIMFREATAFNNGGNGSIDNWNTAAVINMSQMFSQATSFNQNISSWNTGLVTNMSFMFNQASAFNQNIGSWNTSNVTNMESMFQQATNFDQNIGSWNTGSVTNMANMFLLATAFDQNIGSWITNSVTNMSGLFFGASAFDNGGSGSIVSWNTAAVTNMSSMFYQASSFNQSISSWNTDAVTNMESMFRQASVFNQDISSWNTAAVTNMNNMFNQASAFNQNIGAWNTEAVTNMQFMFSGASAFDQDIGSWNTGAVLNMDFMFFQASSFNQNIGAWNTGAVNILQSMFSGASAFNQNIGSWALKPGVVMNNMLDNSGMDCNNYSSTLIGWSANPSTPDGRSLGATGMQYGTNADAARTNLTVTKGWTITGDTPSGVDCAPPTLVPTITSFTPTSGPIGTTVTVTGTNFSATLADNIVFFGATKAMVTTATPTQLTVTVPVGATYQPISVLVTGLTAYSGSPFLVTFPGAGPLDACAFATSVDFLATASLDHGLAVSDLDADGKVDLVTNSFNGANTINHTSIYRNTSTPGEITITSFLPAVNLTTLERPVELAIGDLDGDGKPDIAVVHTNGNAISVYKNISTSGTLDGSSFAPSVDFVEPGISFTDVAIADLDLDGKPELIATPNSVNQVFVYQNVSVTGSITSASFSSRINFPAGTVSDSKYVAIADLDNDGKPEIIVTLDNIDRMAILKNTTTSGVINASSFAPGVEFATGRGPEEVKIGDLDGDSKPDIVVANWLDNDVSVFRNTTTTGVIDGGSFAPEVQFLTGQTPDSMEITDVDGDGKPDLIVPSSSVDLIAVLRNTSTAGSITSSSFAAKVDFSMPNSASKVVMGDFDGDGKPDMAALNYAVDEISILRNTIVSPAISSFTPTSGSVGTSVTINGTNFSTIPTGNTVLFNGMATTVTASTSTSITATVPSGATTGIVSVTVACKTATSVSNFTVTVASIPTITSFTPISGPIGTTVTITGTDFDTTPANNIVHFGAARAMVTAATSTTLTVTVPVGATYEPITVTVGGLTGYSTHRFVVTHSSGSISFNDKICFPVGSTPREVAMADLNNDGHLDLIVTRTDVSTATLFFGNGNGSFQPPTSITTGSGGAITVGDFSGDGVLDLAFANYSGTTNATASVLINDGMGGFPATDTYFLSNPPVGIGSGAVYIADADFNLDGLVDLVSAIDNIPGSLSILLNNGTSFDPKVEYPTNAIYPYSVTTADLNNDGYPDWVVAKFFSNIVKVFINNGSGGVLSETTYAAGSGTHEVELGDLNKDGHLDLVAINATGNTLSVLLNDGSGSFGAKTDYAAGSGYQADLELSDIDGDGNLDAIAGASGTQIFVMKGDGLGGFDAPQAFNVDTNAFGISVGDLDEDGEPDIATANFGDGTVCILLSKPILNITTFAPTSGPIGTTVTISGTSFDTTPANNIVYFGATQATVISATATEITVTVPAGATYQPISVLVNGLTAFSSKPFNVTFCSVPGISGGSFETPTNLGTAPSSGPVSIAVGDLDGDGKADLAVANRFANTISLFRNTSSAPGIVSYAPKVDLATGFEPISIAFGDLDGDGKGDLAVAIFGEFTVSVFRNTSSGPGNISFTPKIDFVTGPPGAGPFSVSLGDLDNDGKPDLAIANYLSHQASVLRNTSNAGDISFAPRIDFPLGAGAGPYSIALGDIDQDGKGDMVTANAIGNSVSVFLNTSIGAGNISYAPRINFSAGTTPRSVSLGDLDGDDKPDIAVTAELPDMVSVFRNTSTAGSASFASRLDFTTASNPWSVSIGDLDGDGKADLATANEGGVNVSVLHNTSPGAGTISFAANVNFAGGGGLVAISLGDLDNDGKSDIATAEFNGDVVSIYRNTIISFNPSISSFAPASGSTGTVVTITGLNFSTTATDNIVEFNGVQAIVTSSTATTITTSVPTGAVTGTISVSTVCGTASGSSFTVEMTAVPTIISFTPNSGPIGTTVTITGTNFSTIPANNVVQFNGTNAVVTTSTATSITTTVPAGATTGTITVTVAGNTATSATNFTVTVSGNQPPVILTTSSTAVVEGSVTIDLLPLISDPENELDISSLSIKQAPLSGAPASITGTTLTIDYAGINFSGIDNLIIEVCDLSGNCAENQIFIDVAGDILIYTGISPNGDGLNEFFKIQYVDILAETQSNKVFIYNRWGDEVWVGENYDNDAVVFTGLNNNGNELPSGTYFYKIEFSSGRATETGYIALKR